jgi:hypothetical protein
VPYLHVRMTPSETIAAPAPAQRPLGDTEIGSDRFADERPVFGEEEFVPYTG